MIRVAFCSEDEQYVDAHFAISPKIIIYEFERSSFAKVDVVSFKPQGGQNTETQDGAETQEFERRAVEGALAQRIEAVKGSDLVYCGQIGGPAIAKLIQYGVFPLKTQEKLTIADAAQRLYQMFKENPPDWLQNKL